jgi:hypothetical protein
MLTPNKIAVYNTVFGHKFAKHAVGFVAAKVLFYFMQQADFVAGMQVINSI